MTQVIDGEIIDDKVDNKASEWFISAINGNLDFLKNNHIVFSGSRGEGGRTALMYAADSGNLDCVKFLVGIKGEIGKQDNSGNTALMYAAKKGFLDCVSVLVDEENNIINNENKRAVNFAIENGHGECAGFLELYEYLDDDEDKNDNTTSNNDDSNDERNLIKENKKLKKEEQILKKANRDVDKAVGIEEIKK